MYTKNSIRKGVLLALALPLAVAAPQQSIAQDDGPIEEIITTGTRAKSRSVEDSPAPVDVLPASYFQDQGDTDLANLVRNVVPSFNVNAQPISDAATIVRPANLRGLAPDHTLVLINGKRRHRAAVIYWLGNGVADGAQGPDISTIPALALERVEVLRDGAAAQYGSDALAGVMNFILKDNAEGATVEARFGQFSEGDGQQYAITANVGLPLTDAGFANFTVEYGNTDPTDRSIQRDDAAALIAAGNTAVANPAQVWGTPEIKDDLKLWGNLGLDLGNGMEAYAFGNLASKTVDGGFYFRNPTNRGGVYAGPTVDATGSEDPNGIPSVLVGNLDPGNATCPDGIPLSEGGGLIPDPTILAAVEASEDCWSFVELFPGGFTPRFGGDVADSSLRAGVRGETDGGFNWDLSAAYGRNEVDFFIYNTVNASLGPQTPVSFDPGAYIQFDQMYNLDMGFAPTERTYLAFGTEYRVEEFEIRVGEEQSFEIGPLADQGFSAASNGFPGFSNLAGGQFDRRNWALYVDGEWEPTDSLLLSAAVRYEDFNDFGTTTNYKIAGNWRIFDSFGVRATASTGFKAPTPGQANAFNVSTEFDLVLNDLVNNGTIPSTSPPAELRGGQPLQPEESTNVTAGVFFNFGLLDVTVDWFQSEVEDRLSLSQLFQLTDEEVDDLIDAGFTSAGNIQNFRFFVNDFDTKTTGFDVVATLPVDWAAGSTDFSLAFNQTKTEVTDAGATIDATRIREIQEGLPEFRYNLAANHAWRDWRFLLRYSYFDDWYDSEDGNVYAGKGLLDLEVGYTWNETLTFVVGGQNVTDTVPDENPGAAAGVGRSAMEHARW